MENPGYASDWMGGKQKGLAIKLGGSLTVPGLVCEGVLTKEQQNEKNAIKANVLN